MDWKVEVPHIDITKKNLESITLLKDYYDNKLTDFVFRVSEKTKTQAVKRKVQLDGEPKNICVTTGKRSF